MGLSMKDQYSYRYIYSEYNSYLEMIDAGVWEYFPQTDELVWSQRIYSIFNIDNNVRLSKESIFEYCFDLDKNRVKRAFELCCRKGKPFDLVIQLYNLKRELIWVRYMGRADVESSEVIRVYGLLQNINKEIALKENQKKQNDLFNELINSTNCWIWEVNEEFRIVYISPKIEEIMGYKRSDLIGKSLSEFFRDINQNDLIKEVNIFKESRLPFLDLKFNSITKLGKMISLKMNGIPVFDYRGNYTGYKGVVEDITYEYNIDNEIISQKLYLESILASLDACAIVSITDRRGLIISANDMFCSVSGYERSELLGKTHRIIKSGYHEVEFWQDLWDTINDGKTWIGEICNRSKNGSFYWVHTVIHPILNSDGQIIQFLSVRNVITKQKQIEKKLWDQNLDLRKTQNELTATVAQLRSTMNLINREISFAENLQKSILPNTEYFINKIGFSIRLDILYKPLNQVSGDIYDYFFLEPGKFRIFIADAAGHGITAGFQTMFIQTEYQRIKDEFSDPAVILDYLNQSIWKTFPDEPIHYSCCLIDVDLNLKKINYVNSAHPEPIIVMDKQIILIETTFPLMGLLKNVKAKSQSICIESDFRLYLYTDGVTEVHNSKMEIFDQTEFLKFIKMNNLLLPSQFNEKLDDHIVNFREEKSIFDDLTLMIFDFLFPTSVPGDTNREDSVLVQ